MRLEKGWMICLAAACAAGTLRAGDAKTLAADIQARHGRSAEAEVRELLAVALLPEDRPRLGDALVSLGRDLALTDEEVDALEGVREESPAEPPRFT